MTGINEYRGLNIARRGRVGRLGMGTIANCDISLISIFYIRTRNAKFRLIRR